MDSFLLILQIVVALLLITVVMMQKTASEGLGFGSMNNNSIVSGQSATNFLSKTTIVLAAVFMINSLALAIVMDKKYHGNNITSKIENIKKEDTTKDNTKTNNPVSIKE